MKHLAITAFLIVAACGKGKTVDEQQPAANDRVGEVVTLNFPNNRSSSCAANGFTGTAIVPSGLRPVTDYIAPLFVQDNGSQPTTPGAYIVTSSGQIVFYKSVNSNFTNAANWGFHETSITYQSN